MSNTFPDRILIEARNSSFRLEKLAIAELRANIDGYLAPNLRARTMIDDWDQFAGNGGFATEEQYRNFRYACEETRMQSNSVFSRVLSKHIPVSRPNMADTMFDGLVTKPDAKSNSKVLVNGEDEIEKSSDAWTKIIDAGYRNLEAYGWWKVPVLAPPTIVKSLRAKIEKQLAASHGQEAIDATIAGKEGAKLAHWINSGHTSTYEELYQLSSDPLLFSIVQKYMGVPPIFNTPVSVLSGPVKVKATKEMEGTGQLYHYDMHRLKFVKMFIYLTDVARARGPIR